MKLVNPLKEKLAAGKPVLGMWSVISSPMVIEIMGLSGLDFLILDMEHGTFDAGALDTGVRACEGAGCAPLVRLPGLNASAAQWALDAGACGIIVPQVSGTADVETVVGMAKYAPRGTRGYNPFTRCAGYANPPDNTGGKLHNDYSLTAVIVENQSALDSLDDILAIPDLDVVYIGVYDLSVALDCAGNTAHPRVQDVVSATVGRIRAAGKAAGLMVTSQESAARALALGANFLVWSVDTHVIRKAGEAAVAAVAAAAASHGIQG